MKYNISNKIVLLICVLFIPLQIINGTWVKIQSPLLDENYIGLVSLENDIYCVSKNSSIYKFDGVNQSWINIYQSDLSNDSIEVIQVLNYRERLFARILNTNSDTHILSRYSVDLQKWENVYDDNDVKFSASNEKKLYLVIDCDTCYIRSLITDTNGYDETKIIYCIDNNLIWQDYPVPKGNFCMGPSEITFYDSTIYIHSYASSFCSGYYGNRISYSNNEIDWKNAGGQGGYIFAFGNYIFAYGLFLFSHGGVYVSIATINKFNTLDSTWYFDTLPDYANYVNDFEHAQDSILLAGTSKGIFRTLDVGESWHVMSNGVDTSIYIIDLLKQDSIIYALERNGAVYYFDMSLYDISVPIKVSRKPFFNSPIYPLKAESKYVFNLLGRKLVDNSGDTINLQRGRGNSSGIYMLDNGIKYQYLK